jgi:PucR family transcriptional regulator, purine catabolism regulatory protein
VHSQSSAVSLGDLLREEAFGLRLLSGGPDAADRPVLGAHTVEVENPARWLAEHWVMLTTGVRLKGDAGAQGALVHELVDAGVTALGFGVGVVFEDVPQALLDEATKTGFPLISVPYETAFRDLTQFVDAALGRGEEHVFRRLSALQRYLVDAMREPEPEQTMLERLARFLDATVVILTGDGELKAATGEAPVAELWAQIASQPTGLREVAAAGWHAVAAPVSAAAGGSARWLVLTSRRPGFIGKLVKPAAETAAPLLAAMSGLERIVRSQEEAVRGALLREALAALDPRQAAELAARTASFGLDFTQPARVVVLRGGEGEELTRATLEALRAPYLLTRLDEGVVALVQAGASELSDALEAIVAAQEDALIGIGRGVDEVGRLNHSFRDARLAADRAGLELGRRVLSFDDFDLGTFAVSEIAPDRLAPKVDKLMSVLRANPPLHEALLAYFQNDLDVGVTAGVLHLHPNSLRYRLARVEALLEVSLKQPSTIASLYLALIADAGERRQAPLS